jgi:hypothetical protein
MVNEWMKRSQKPVLGVHAPATRPTLYAAFCVATALSIPVACVLWVVEWFWM